MPTQSKYHEKQKVASQLQDHALEKFQEALKKLITTLESTEFQNVVSDLEYWITLMEKIETLLITTNNKNVILVCGKTGDGKSLGCSRFVSVKSPPDFYDMMSAAKTSPTPISIPYKQGGKEHTFKIGRGGGCDSCTVVPNPVTIIGENGKSYLVIDMPGFNEAAPHKKMIVHLLHRLFMLSSVNVTKIVVVVDVTMFTCDHAGSWQTEMVDIFKAMFGLAPDPKSGDEKKFSTKMKSVLFVVNKIDRLPDGIVKQEANYDVKRAAVLKVLKEQLFKVQSIGNSFLNALYAQLSTNFCLADYRQVSKENFTSLIIAALEETQSTVFCFRQRQRVRKCWRPSVGSM